MTETLITFDEWKSLCPESRHNLKLFAKSAAEANARLSDAHARITLLETNMPCGHPSRYLYPPEKSVNGSRFCLACQAEENAVRARTLSQKLKELEAETSSAKTALARTEYSERIEARRAAQSSKRIAELETALAEQLKPQEESTPL